MRMASKHTAQLPYPALSYCTPLFFDGELYSFCIFLKCTYSCLSETKLLTIPCSFCDNFQYLWQSRKLLIQLLHLWEHTDPVTNNAITVIMIAVTIKDIYELSKLNTYVSMAMWLQYTIYL